MMKFIYNIGIIEKDKSCEEKLNMDKGIQPKTNGRPRKAERDHGKAIFLTQSHNNRITDLAARLQRKLIASGVPQVGIDRKRSAALRSLIDRGWPEVSQTSNRGDHSESNVVINFYMPRAYLEMLDGFVEQIKETGKQYNRSMAVRDIIDLYLRED